MSSVRCPGTGGWASSRSGSTRADLVVEAEDVEVLLGAQVEVRIPPSAPLLLA
jgi:hypothetical protein